MCGLIAFIATKDSADTKEAIMTQFQEQIHRGKEGFGILDIDKTHLNVHRAVEPTKAYFDLYQSLGRVIAFHHRNPTSTKNTLKQTHPIFVSHKKLDHDYYVMHNGVISNSRELRPEHEAEGFVYSTLVREQYASSYPYAKTSASFYEKFNDTESFAIELAKVLDGETKEIQALGSMAFIAVQIDKETKLAKRIMWGRNDRNPLYVEQRENGLLIASEIDTEGAEEVYENTYEVLDLELLKKKVMPTDIISLLDVKDIAFAEPKPVPKVDVPTRTTTGFNTGSTQGIPSKKDSTPSETTTAPTSTGNGYEGYTPRETAFIKMSERISQAFWPQVCDTLDQLFLRMAEDEMMDDDIDEYLTDMVTDLRLEILKKEDIARERIRPMFDNLEAAEDARIQEEDDRALAELDERIAQHVDEDSGYGAYDNPGFEEDLELYRDAHKLSPNSHLY